MGVNTRGVPNLMTACYVVGKKKKKKSSMVTLRASCLRPERAASDLLSESP